MSDWLHMLGNGLLFRDAPFVSLRERGDAFLQGFLIIVVIALLVGAPTFVSDVAAGLRPNTAEVEMDKAMSEVDQVMQQMQPFLSNIPGATSDLFLSQIKDNMRFGFDIAKKVDALPTALPRPLNRVFEAVGKWVSRPFASEGLPLGAAALGTWLGYGIWVMLCAKLLGGRGTLTGFFGATALYAVPHVLSFFAFVPVLGSILGFIAFFWGLALYVKATKSSHQLSLERALLAVLLPALAVLLLVIVGATGIATLIAVGAAGGS